MHEVSNVLIDAEIGIARLQRAYADAVTRRDAAALSATATSDCRMIFDTIDDRVIHMDGAEKWGRFAARALGRFEFYVYTINNYTFDLTSDTTAQGSTFAHEVGVLRDTGEVGNYWAMYYDDYVRLDGVWLFSGRRHQATGHKVGDGHMEIFPLRERPQD